VLLQAVGRERGDALTLLRGEETAWPRVLEAARTRSLFAERRALVVRNAEALRGDGEGLAAYLDDPTPGVSLIFVAAKVDKRRSLWKTLLERAAVVTVEPLRERELRARLATELRGRGLQVDAEGVEEIASRVGQDLRRLVGELDKLEAFAQGRPLTAEQVAACLGRGIAQPLYRLSDAFVARDASSVLARMEEVLAEGEAPVLVLGTLFRALRQVRGAAGLAGAPFGELASRLQVPPFKVKALLDGVRRWPQADLRTALDALATADERLKSGVDGRVALAAAVAAACQPAPRPWRPRAS
jgi:DNA polymerase-3 subunit delta